MNEQSVIGRLRGLVDAGEYLDELLGRPGENTDGAVALRLDGTDFQGLDDFKSRGRRVYRRGSPEHADAKRAGLIDPLPPLVVATEAEVRQTENELGHAMPPLLVELYTKVGNGGFGPGYGILGIAEGFTDDLKQDAVGARRSLHLAEFDDEAVLLPICHWGCAIYSMVDLRSSDAQVWGFDPNGADGRDALYHQNISLETWLERWLEGRLHQPAVIEDPGTGEWRGATEDEMDEWASEFDEP